MVDRSEEPSENGGVRRRRLPLTRSLLLVLLALTVALAVIAALGLGSLYAERQRYEDTLARSYELEAAAARLQAAGVIEESTLGASAADRRRTGRAFRTRAREARQLAGGDRTSTELVRRRIDAQRRVRLTAAALRRSPSRAGRERVERAVTRARSPGDALARRQRERRAVARDAARAGTRSALRTTAGAGVLGLLGAVGLIFALIGSIRRPLDELVEATLALAAGQRAVRVTPAGPRELRELDASFNSMAGRLERAQDRIEAEREKLAVTVESLRDGLVVCDAEGAITATNPRVAEIAPALVPGADVGSVDSPLPPLEQALAGEVEVEWSGRVLSVTAASLDRRRERGTVWTLRDISERARVDRLKSDFVATASHELRSPLTSIKGFVELLGRSQTLGGREREFVDVILGSTDRLVELVNDLLDVARLDAGRMEVHPRLFDLAEVVRDVATLMRPRTIEKDQRLDLDLPPGLPRALADPARVRQVLINLVSNAHQYTPEGGRIELSLAGVAGELELVVADDGRGMTQDDLDHVFDRFVRRADGGGTGLGLSIVRSLVDLQQGSVDVRSRLGEGTTFAVRLPVEPGGAREAPAAAMRGKRVLIAADGEAAGRALARTLAVHEIQAEVAARGEALARLRQGGFDALVVDADDGDGEGFRLLRELRADPALRRSAAVVIVGSVRDEQALFGEWRVAAPAAAERLADTLGAALLAGRTSVLVAGRSIVRARLEPALVRLGLDHEWVTSGPAAARACEGRRFEVALVDARIGDPETVLRALDLRGRRTGHAVLAFTTDGADEVPSTIAAETVPIDEAAAAVLRTLSQDARSRRAAVSTRL